MSTYLYDGTFPNLLNLITKLINHNIKPTDIKPKDNFETTLLDEGITLELDEAFRVKDLKIPNPVIKTCYYVFLSSDKNKELIIYYFLLNEKKYHNKIFYMRNLKCVNSALKLAKQVSNETHKLKGFVRFKEINNHILYSTINPTSDCLHLLSIHFAKRLKQEYWIIKDERRNKYSIYDKKRYYIVSGENLSLKEMIDTKEESEIENLWLTFFKTIGIKERENKRCQMNFMPKKYWHNMLEMREEYEKSNNRRKTI